MGNTLHYEHRNYLLKNGNIADKLRLATSGNDLSDEQIAELMDEVKQVQNKDGGIPFGVQPGNPSSVKETSEILALISICKQNWTDIIDEMVKHGIIVVLSHMGAINTNGIMDYMDE